jgi:hypothetical protein
MSDSKKWHGGKGSRQRPVNKDQFDKNWDKIFNKKSDKKQQLSKDKT